ncbi:flagellar export chaperone FliS [Luteitalea sp.]|jgi:flagellar protein FliS|uniref:flagellar export chaperone FliS n=1 Tax=Luteitalea sp. TaxID=2004800 RepID=UPI0037C79EAF
MYNKGAQAYLQTQVQSRTPVELVVMLYDGAIKFLGQARDAMAARDMKAKRDAMSRGLAIVQELQNMLNMEAGGEVAERLDALYTYILGRCYEANQQRDPAGLDEAIKLLTPLRDAWADVAQNPNQAG